MLDVGDHVPNVGDYVSNMGDYVSNVGDSFLVIMPNILLTTLTTQLHAEKMLDASKIFEYIQILYSEYIFI